MIGGAIGTANVINILDEDPRFGLYEITKPILREVYFKKKDKDFGSEGH